MRLLILLVLSGVTAAAGCGGSGGADRSEDSQSSPPANALEAPLHPRCGVEAFGPPRVSEIRRFGGWRLTYNHPAAARAPQVEGITTSFVLDERPADSTRVPYRDKRTVRIHGRVVDISRSRAGFIAQWVTDRARYVVVGNGSGSIVRELVRCTR